MEASEFVRHVKDLSFMPDWHIEAWPDAGDAVYVEIRFPARDSSVEFAPGGYTRWLRNGASRAEIIEIGDLETAEDAHAAVLGIITRVFEHEAREFLRLPGEEWRAPFHPHHTDGEAAWQRQQRHVRK